MNVQRSSNAIADPMRASPSPEYGAPSTPPRSVAARVLTQRALSIVRARVAVRTTALVGGGDHPLATVPIPRTRISWVRAFGFPGTRVTMSPVATSPNVHGQVHGRCGWFTKGSRYRGLGNPDVAAMGMKAETRTRARPLTCLVAFDRAVGDASTGRAGESERQWPLSSRCDRHRCLRMRVVSPLYRQRAVRRTREAADS